MTFPRVVAHPRRAEHTPGSLLERGGQGEVPKIFFRCFKRGGCLKDRCPLGERMLFPLLFARTRVPGSSLPPVRSLGVPTSEGGPRVPAQVTSVAATGALAPHLLFTKLCTGIPSRPRYRATSIFRLCCDHALFFPPFYHSPFFRCSRGEE